MGKSCIENIIVFLCCLGSVTRVAATFPLLKCIEGQTDLLIVTDTAMPDGCLGPGEVKTFLLETVDMFLSPTESTTSRLRISLVSDTSSGLVTILDFKDSLNSENLRENISNFTECDISKTTYKIRESTILRTTDLVNTAFSEEHGSRAGANHVVISLISRGIREEVEDIHNTHNKKYLVNSKLFIILIDPDEIYKSRSSPNIISVISFSRLSNNQLISMTICKKCRSGWLQFEHQNPFDHLSCYFLSIDSSTSHDWYQAQSKCDTIDSSLASIETNDELAFLEKQLYEMLVTREDLSLNWDIFIGLRRRYEILPTSFKWINMRPLVVSHWQEKSPHGSYANECGIWRYQIPDLQNRTSENFDQYTMKYKNGWDDIGCGVPQSRMSLCEITVENSSCGTAHCLEIGPAPRESINSALSRGEFTEFNGKIVSVPATVENSEFYSALYNQDNVGFKLFDCKEDEGTGRQIAFSYVCDNIQHCSNRRDEDLCLYRRCDNVQEFECHSHQCVPRETRCDSYADCFDQSDEDDCIECQQKRCCDGTCVPKHWFNEDIDCSSCLGNTDNNDPNKTRDERPDELCSFICNRTSCVNPSQFDDGVPDCTGPEGPLDETVGKLERVYSCAADVEVLSWAPRCVYVKDRYDGVLGCKDLSHLWNCESFNCPGGYAKCSESYCIPLHYILDGKMDCPLGEDEKYLKAHNCEGNFACWNSRVCLHPDLVCDGNPDCPFRDDEQNCEVTCANGFRCVGGTVTVSNYKRNIPLQSLAFIHHDTRYLDLSGIIISLAFSRHEKRQLGNLIIILLSKCEISNVDQTFASDATNLQSVYSLDVSYNRIAKVPSNSIFKFMTNLHNLNLSNNNDLITLEQNAFVAYAGKSKLESIDLSYTSIYKLQSSCLENLVSLKVLDLSNTHISQLLGNSFPTDFKLKILYLHRTDVSVYNVNAFNGVIIEEYFYTENYELCCPQIRGPGIAGQVCHAPNDAISSCSDLIREDVQRVLLWLVGLIAVLGNLTVVICRLLSGKGVITKAYGVFVTNLGISDLIMGLYLLMIAIVDVHYRGVYVTNSIFWKNSTLCHIAGFLSTLSSETSAFFILLITIDRFLVIKFPFGQYSFSRSTTIISSALAWGSGFSLALTPSLPVFNNWTIYYANGMCLGLPLTTERLGGWEYSVAIFVGVNTIMFVFIAAGQISIYRAMSGNRAAKTAIHNSNRRAQDIAVAKQLSMVVLTDFLCYFPVGLMGLLAITGHDIGKDAYAWSAVLVLPINSAINPILYTVPIIQSKWQQFIKAHCQRRTLRENTFNSKPLSILSKVCDFNLPHRVN